ncbi:MAG: flagellar biosynthesis anti-sigma factor FlgM [Deltaproteobacteria bacterium]|nr:flagellar biosynthesis anti-sigma factor FlgM [Deltaproteobacteria bacterium]
MKINEISNNMNQIGNLESSQSRLKETASVNNQPAEKEFEKGAKVDISSTSVEFSKAAEKMENVPKDRADKVEQLKMMVQNDTYNVDSKKIAEKVLEDSISNII